MLKELDIQGYHDKTDGPERLLFGTDSSFFPRGWHRAIYETQVNALDTAGVANRKQSRSKYGAKRPKS
jgi:hypothetical protein